jgi:predicted nucleic acid-binding protein
MNVYLDSSVVLGRLQGERAPTIRWARWEHAYSSVLLRAEVLRTIDRSRLRQALTDQNVAELISRAHAVFDTLELVTMSQPILDRASQSFSTAVGTLDALHLATALRLREIGGIEMTFLTHDAELAVAARSMNFPVEGSQL